MKQSILFAFATHRHRYWFGSILFFVLFLTISLIASSVQNGLTLAEQHSAVTSATLPLSTDSLKNVVDLPYHLMQKASLSLFGLSTLGIKLPSYILGFIVACAVLPLLNRWLLRASVALFAGLIAISNGQFINTMAGGTPLIMIIFWGVIIFLAGLVYVKDPKSTKRLVLLITCLALSLYTPLSIYLVITLAALSYLHPRLRYIVRSLSLTQKLYAGVLALLLISPLIGGIINEPTQFWRFLGIPLQHIDGGLLRNNIATLLKLYGSFWYGNVTPIGIGPVFGVASLGLILFGGMRLLRDMHAARSYGLLLLFPALSLPIILQPQYVIILLVPMTLLLAIGVEGLLDEWYKLFPFNPYARVVALAPTVVLLASIVISNVTFYTNVMLYNENVPRFYSHDLSLMKQTLHTYPDATIVTTDLEYNFYDLLRRDYPKTTVVKPEQFSHIERKKPFIITPGTGINTESLGTPALILSSYFKDQTPRLYVYSTKNGIIR